MAHINANRQTHPLNDPYLLIAMGIYPGIEAYTKFGTNPTASDAYEPVWAQSTAWVKLPAATTLEIASSATADDFGSTGATMVLLSGCAADYSYQEEIVVLDGQTPVVTTKVWLFVNRCLVVAAGSGGTSAGDIYVADDSTDWASGVPSTAAAIQAKLLAGHAFTQQAIFTVPLGVAAYVTNHWVSAAAGKAVSYQFMNVDNENNVTRVGLQGELLNAHVERTYRPYAQVPEKYTIYTQAKVGTGAGIISAGFDMILVKNGDV